MFKDKKIIAIIPARSGSKGLKDKNIKEINSKPLICYTVDSAIKSNVFDYIIVSTDSEKYAQIAKKSGASVPFLRSEKNSSDSSGSWDAVREVIDKLKKEQNLEFDIVVLLQPTSPLRNETHIKEALELFFKKQADTLFSVCETPHPMFWCNTLDETLSAKDFVKKEYQKQRQQLPKSYTLNGAIYILKTENLKNLDFYTDKGFAYIMDKASSIDIDTEIDFELVKIYMNSKQKEIK